MSTASQIERLTTARNTIRTKLVALGLAESTDKLDDLATIISGIANRGDVSVTLDATTGNQSYTVPAGYHSGSGEVAIVLEETSVTPTKSSQDVTPSSGKVLSKVTVAAIPAAYQDVTSVTAAAGDVLATKIFVAADGTVTTGTMTNNGAVSHTLDATTSNQSYTVPAGYHNGSGAVGIVLETKSATPTKSSQDITPTGGKVLSKVTVAAIPDAYQDVTNVDATADDVLYGKVIVDASGTELTGTIPTKTASDLTAADDTVTVPAGYYASQVTKAVAGGSATTPATSITATPAITVGNDGLITVSVSETESVTPTVVAGYVSAGTAGNVTVSGSATEQLNTLAATTYNTSASDQTIEAGQFLTGDQTIRGVTTENISAANIKTGVTVKVGDAADDDRIAGVAGTFTAANTVSQGQTAAAAGNIMSGYSAWVDGVEVQGTIDTIAITEGTTTVSGETATRGIAEWDAGVIAAGSIGAATFANTATEDVTYVDISGTTDAPVLVSGNYLYINKGYTDNLKISLAKLVPDGATVGLASGHMLSGYTAYDSDGALITGNIPSLAATTYNTSTTDQTIAAGQYLSGAQTILAVQTSGISAGNIKYGEVVKVGDSADDDRIAGVTGTFTGANTVSTGQTAAGAGQILTGYSAFIDGAEVQGSMTNNGGVSQTLDATTNNQSYTVPAGYHNGNGTVNIVLEEKSATPADNAQDITPTAGKVLSKVTVAAIPANYGNTTGDDAAAGDILYGKTAHSNSNGSAVAVTGSMPNNGAVAATIDGLTTLSYTIPAGYHNGSGTVSLTDDIETALAAI